jgi:hypothetical protein
VKRSAVWKWFAGLAPPWQAAVVLGLLLVIGIIIGSVAGGSSKSATKSTPSQATTAAVEVTDMDGYQCDSAKAKYARCPSNPYYGKTIAQVSAAKKAKARAEARALAAAKAKARREAAAHAAYVRAANAWHQGYYQQDSNIYWKWRNDLDCSDYATDGCWRVEVITRNGCPSYLGVTANEYRGGSVVGDLLDNNGNGVPPKTSALFELDADPNADTANDVTIQCE